VRPEAELLTKSKHSLDLAKELDEQFGDLLQEAVYYSNRRILHQSVSLAIPPAARVLGAVVDLRPQVRMLLKILVGSSSTEAPRR
jgi:hypothetical protein